jgi:hypothetical protein
VSLGLLIFFFLDLLVFYYMARKGKTFEIKKKIAAFEMLPEAVGRATEMGKPMHGATGGSSTTSWRGPHVVAGLTVMGYVAELCAKSGVALYVSPIEPDQLVLAEDAVRGGYTRAGRPDLFKREYILFHGREDASYAIGIWGFLDRERPAAQLLLGGYGSEALQIAEMGNKIGALQIGGTPTTWQVPFLAVSVDYLMIGDELFAAGCIASRDPLDASFMIGEDVLKGLIIFLIVIGALAATLGSDLLPKFLGM